MPKATSKKQQMAAGAALSAKRGERGKSSLKGASKSMYESMTKEELKRIAERNGRTSPPRNNLREAYASDQRLNYWLRSTLNAKWWVLQPAARLRN